MNIWEQLIERPDWPEVIGTGVRIVLILVSAWLVRRCIRIYLNHRHRKLVQKAGVEENQINEVVKRTDTLFRLLRQVTSVMVWVVAILMILRELGVSIAPMLASVGIVGLALGFGAQYYVRDIIAGFFMILENQVRVNDVVIINGTGGLVEEVNLRTLVLRDRSGVVHVFANGTINTLSNMTKEWSAYLFEIGVAYKEDTDRVVEILKRVGAELRTDKEFGALIKEDIEVYGVDKFDESGVVLKGRWVTEPIQQWTVGREFLRRVKQAFDAEGVEIPFPHRSVYFGEASKPFLAQLLNKDLQQQGKPQDIS